MIWLGLHVKMPERRLMANVLADGVYLLYRSKSTALAQESLDWLMSDDHSGLTTFLGLAEEFDLDPEAVRRDVRADVEAGRTAARLTLC